MSIELPEDARSEAIASIQRYFDANMEEPIGNVAAFLTIWSMLYYMKLAWPQIRERGSL